MEASENGNGFFIKSVNAADDSSNPFGLEYYNGNFTTYKFNAYNGAFLFQFYTTGAAGFTDALAAGDQVVIYNPTSSVGMSSQPPQRRQHPGSGGHRTDPQCRQQALRLR